MAAGNERGRPGGCPRRLPLVLFDLGVMHGRWCFAALEMCLGVFLGERRVGRQDDVDRAFLIERATVEPDGLGRLAVRHVQDQVGIEECPRGKRDLVSACRLFLRNQDNLGSRSHAACPVLLYSDYPIALGQPDRGSRFGPADLRALGDLGHREETFPGLVGLVSDAACFVNEAVPDIDVDDARLLGPAAV